jgi:hypothetical protein
MNSVLSLWVVKKLSRPVGGRITTFLARDSGAKVRNRRCKRKRKPAAKYGVNFMCRLTDIATFLGAILVIEY